MRETGVKKALPNLNLNFNKFITLRLKTGSYKDLKKRNVHKNSDNALSQKIALSLLKKANRPSSNKLAGRATI